ncbi:hypothetical protein CRG98_027333 [Punica granatum]|uniref:Uncharacterized protein n=1 Tax=Punica granatum TaxID=22663 RepID=A0A2I0J7R6_PUNGR|nr:hypothetical protein CRG98_027333 [Punica granatum]
MARRHCMLCSETELNPYVAAMFLCLCWLLRRSPDSGVTTLTWLGPTTLFLQERGFPHVVVLLSYLSSLRCATALFLAGQLAAQPSLPLVSLAAALFCCVGNLFFLFIEVSQGHIAEHWLIVLMWRVVTCD